LTLFPFFPSYSGDFSLVMEGTAPHPTSSFVVAVFELGDA
jgi:hypothetical protein